MTRRLDRELYVVGKEFICDGTRNANRVFVSFSILGRQSGLQMIGAWVEGIGKKADHEIDMAFTSNTGFDIRRGPANRFGQTLLMQTPIYIKDFVTYNNRTQIAIAKQEQDFFWVRCIIEYLTENRARTNRRHSFLLAYGGKAPTELFGKASWGNLYFRGPARPGTL